MEPSGFCGKNPGRAQLPGPFTVQLVVESVKVGRFTNCTPDVVVLSKTYLLYLYDAMLVSEPGVQVANSLPEERMITLFEKKSTETWERGVLAVCLQI